MGIVPVLLSYEKDFFGGKNMKIAEYRTFLYEGEKRYLTIEKYIRVIKKFAEF